MYREVFFVLIIVVCSNSHENLFEGDACLGRGDVPGTCVNIDKCDSAIRDIMEYKIPRTCSFKGSMPIVCCADFAPPTVSGAPQQNSSGSQWMTTQPIPQTTAAYIDFIPLLPNPTPERTKIKPVNPKITPVDPPTTPMFSDAYPKRTDPKKPTEVVDKKLVEEECPAISSQKTAVKTGKKAWDKCIEYQERFVFPCDRGQHRRINNCRHDISTFIVGGTDAFEGEFPHMALLGYGSEENLSFLCGGSVISDKFILTAGHCSLNKKSEGDPFVLVGTFNKLSYNRSNLYKVKRVLLHPNYRPPMKYHDIALFETEKRININEYLVPACLDTGDDTSTRATAVATGWGVTHFGGNSSDTLQKVTLEQFEGGYCSNRFPPNRVLRKGFDSETQLCYGSNDASKDTCQGDSGGPLQVKNERIYCMYTIIGITSFGRSCGMIGEPALYTKVESYVSWIEGIVWPDETQ